MTRRAISIYMAATCAMTILAPGRFACGMVLVIELCLIMLFGTLFRALIRKLKLQQLNSILLLSMIVSFTMLFRQLLVLLQPEIALQLGFIIYLPSISTLTTVFLFEKKTFPLKDELKNNIQPALMFSIYTLLFSLVRDILGYGTITVFTFGNVYEKVLFHSERISALNFLATIPGAFVISALILVLYLAIERKIKIFNKAGVIK